MNATVNQEELAEACKQLESELDERTWQQPGQSPEGALMSWMNTMIAREKGQQLKRNVLAQAIHDAVEPIPLPAKEPPKSRWSWLRRLSPRHREIDKIRAVARVMGRDFDEAQAKRFLHHMDKRDRVRMWFTPSPTEQRS